MIEYQHMGALSDMGVTDEEREQLVLSLFKKASALELLSFVEMLSERCSMDSKSIKLRSFQLCDELIRRDTDRWIRDNPGKYRRLLPKRPNKPPPNW